MKAENDLMASGGANMYQGLFLDMDGTLADSMPLLRGVYRDFMTALGLEPSDREFHEYAGYTLPRIMNELNRRHRLDKDPAELAYDFHRMIQQRYHVHVRPSPGARRLLQRAAEAGLTSAVVTSASRQTALEFLEYNKLGHLVGVVVGAEDVLRSKPDPEPFALAVEQAGVEPGRSLAVEDSLNGVLSAVAAGLHTYVIGLNGQTPPMAPGAAGSISRLDELLPLIGAPQNHL